MITSMDSVRRQRDDDDDVAITSILRGMPGAKMRWQLAAEDELVANQTDGEIRRWTSCEGNEMTTTMSQSPQSFVGGRKGCRLNKP